MSARAVSAIWTGAIILALIGVLASAGRIVSVVEGLRGPQPAPELSRLDEFNTRGLALVLGVRPGSREYEDGMAQIRRFLGKFNLYPVTTLLHVVPAAGIGNSIGVGRVYRPIADRVSTDERVAA